MVAVDGEGGVDEFEKIDEEFSYFVSALWVCALVPTLCRSATTDSNMHLLLSHDANYITLDNKQMHTANNQVIVSAHFK